jgi:hypothetical protein
MTKCRKNTNYVSYKLIFQKKKKKCLSSSANVDARIRSLAILCEAGRTLLIGENQQMKRDSKTS